MGMGAFHYTTRDREMWFLDISFKQLSQKFKILFRRNFHGIETINSHRKFDVYCHALLYKYRHDLFGISHADGEYAAMYNSCMTKTYFEITSV